MLAPMHHLSAYLRGAFTDARYRSFTNAPCPLELIGNSTAVCDLSGQALPGTPRVAVSYGGEWRRPAESGEFYVGGGVTTRSSFAADASDSRYLRIGGYTTADLRVGFSSRHDWEVYALMRNAFGTLYLTLVTAQSGNSGAFSALPGDPRTIQLTVRYGF